VFVRDRERKQRSGTEQAGDSAMDLVSYVEFQNNYRALLQSHMSALKAIRGFWRELLKKDVSFNGLSRAFYTMDITEAKADKVCIMWGPLFFFCFKCTVRLLSILLLQPSFFSLIVCV
jgi:hypothetical protein